MQVQNPESKVQRKETGTGADNIILQATTPPHPKLFSPEMSIQWWEKTIHDFLWPSLTFHDLLWPSMTFYHLPRPLWLSMNKCLLYRPALLAGPLHSTTLQFNSQSITRLDPIDSKSSFHLFLYLNIWILSTMYWKLIIQNILNT